MKAFILAGGFGSKLREVIYNQPKILAPVKDQPFIEHLFYLLKKDGFNQIVLGLGYLADQVKNYLSYRLPEALEISYSIDPRPLGTGGSVAYAQKYLEESDFYIINGDTYLDFDYKKALEFHRDQKAVLTIITAKNQYAGEFSRVDFNEDGIVKSINKVSFNDKNQTVHAGIYIASPEIFSMIPKHSKYSLEKHLIPELIKKQQVFAYNCDQTFYDIGNGNGYQLACKELER